MPFSTLPADFRNLNLKSFDAIKPYFDELLSSPLDNSNIKIWLSQWSDLDALISEGGTWIHVNASCHTDNKEFEKTLLDYEQGFVPDYKKMDHALSTKFIESGLVPQGMEIPLKNMRTEQALFRNENLPLETQLAELSNEYGKLQGAWSVEFEGQSRTREAMQQYQEENDRPLREKAWKSFMQRYLQDQQKLDDLFDQMKTLRIQTAKNAGYDNYTQFRFQEFCRFEYTPEDCLEFHEAIAQTMVPLSLKIAKLRKEALGVEKLMPWDAKVDWLGDAPLKPFKDTKELGDKLSRVFQRMSPQLGGYFDTMRSKKWLDLDSRPGKRGGGYCTSLAFNKGAFVFMNAAGTVQDVFTLAHESGHCFHDFLSMGTQPWGFQTDFPIEFAEVASMSMELMVYPYLDEFLKPEEVSRAKLNHLCDIVGLFGYVACIDAFQHFVYANPQASPAERNAAVLKLHQKLCPEFDYSEFKDIEENVWQRKLHVFEYPFYYIDYAMAQIGALQVWRNSIADEASALQAYTEALKLGGTLSRPELFKAAGAEFRFDKNMLEGLAALLEDKINAALGDLGKSALPPL